MMREHNSNMDETAALSTLKMAIGSLGIFQFVFGLVGNCLMLHMFWKFKQLWTPSNNLLIALALADIGICSCIPFSTASTFSGRWIFSSTGCKLYGFGSVFFGLSTIGLITVLSIDRYIAVCRRQLASVLTHTHYAYMVVIAFVNALFWAILPIFGWAQYEEDVNSGCSINWGHGDASYISYICIVSTVCFVIPFVVMAVCFGRAHAVIKKRDQAHDVTDHDDLSPIGSDWANQKQVTRVCLGLVILIFFSWTPFAIICLWGALGNALDVPDWLALLAPFSAKWSQVINPLLFIIFIKKFRDSILAIICRRTPVETIELAPPAGREEPLDAPM